MPSRRTRAVERAEQQLWAISYERAFRLVRPAPSEAEVIAFHEIAEEEYQVIVRLRKRRARAAARRGKGKP